MSASASGTDSGDAEGQGEEQREFLGKGGTVAQLVRLVSLLPSFFFFFFFFFFSFPFPLSCPLFLFYDVGWQGLQAGGKDGTVMGLRLHLLPSDCEDSLRHFFFVLSFFLSFLRISQPPFFLSSFSGKAQWLRCQCAAITISSCFTAMLSTSL